MHIDLIPGATPVYRRPYPVPQVHLETFKKELYHLVDIGVLSPVRDTEWGLPTFITPKMDGTVRWVSDLRYDTAFLAISTLQLQTSITCRC